MWIERAAVTFPGSTRLRRALLAAMPALPALLILAAGSAVAGSGATPAVAPPQRLPGAYSLTSIACVDADTCYVIGRQSSDSGPGLLFTLTDGTLTDEQTLSGAGFLRELACAPDGTCAAFGANDRNPDFRLILPIVDGIPGQAETVEGASLNGIACAGSDACYAVGGDVGPDGSGEGVIVPIVGGRVSPAVPASGTVLLSDIDCPTADICYALGLSGNSSADAVIVPIVDGQPGTPHATDGTAGLVAIACPNADTCYAAGYDIGRVAAQMAGSGSFVTIVDGQPGSAQPVDGTGGLSLLVCPTSDTCFAFGDTNSRGTAANPASGSVAVPIVNGGAGSIFTVDAAGPLISGDCPTSDTCYALTPDAIVPITVSGG